MTSRLPSPVPPFMARDTFRIQADLFPLGSEINGRRETAHFIADREWDPSIAEKLALLEADAGRCRLIATGDPAGLAEALWRVLGLLAADEPSLATIRDDGADLPRLGLRLSAASASERVCPGIARVAPTPLGERVATWLERQEGVARLADAVALACQEDVVIMRETADGAGAAELLHVCFPSGWDPCEKAGASFRAIHEPIADNARLLGSSANVMKAILTKGPYIRFAWGLTLHGDRDSHPSRPKPVYPDAFFADPASVAAHTWLRMERQTTFPMPDLGRGLFTIRIYTDPLTERLAREPALRPRLATLIRTTAPEVRAYKGISRIADPALAWLEGNDG